MFFGRNKRDMVSELEAWRRHEPIPSADTHFVNRTAAEPFRP